MNGNPELLSGVRKVLDMVNVKCLFTDSEGDVLLPEDDRRHISLPPDIRGTVGIPFRTHGYTLISTDEKRPYYLCFMAEGNEIDTAARLACELIRQTYKDTGKRLSGEQMLRYLFHQGTSSFEAETMGRELGIADDRPRCVLCLRILTGGDMEQVLSVIEPAAEAENDLAAEMGYSTLVLVHSIDEDESLADTEQFALALEDSIEVETGAHVLIGLSRVCNTFRDLSAAYREASEAVDVGRVYHVQKRVFLYSRMLPERLLAHVDEREAARYHAEVFNPSTARLLNEEMLQDIETLFENSLNLSETARKLYIHRNTLVYRLEKIARVTGLDLRSFDDAMTFRILMLLGKNRDKMPQNKA